MAFEKILKAKKDNGKSYMILIGVKELVLPFCFTASRKNLPLDGIVLINEPSPAPEDYSGVPIIDLNRNPLPVKQTMLIFAMPQQPLQALSQSFAETGFGAMIALDNDDISEMFSILQFENFLVEKLRAELRQTPCERVLLFNQGSRVSAIKNILSMSGVPLDDVIDSFEQKTDDALLILPIENAQHREVFQSPALRNSERILPLDNGDLLAAEHYWNAHRMFFDYFDLNNVPDFVAKFEARLKNINNSYDGVNFSVLNVDNEDRVTTACAQSLIDVDKKILHIVIPINRQGNQLNYEAASRNALLKKVTTHLRALTPESREFWRYFIKKHPERVSYSASVYDYYAFRYRLEPLKIDSSAIEFSAEERKQLCREKSAKYSATADDMIVSDSPAQRWLAMLLEVPIVLVNMATYTLDEKLIVRSDKSPMLILPRKIFHEPSRRLLGLPEILGLEEQTPNSDIRMQFFNQNGIKTVENTPEEIRAAIDEMRKMYHKVNVNSNPDDEYMSNTFQRLIGKSRDKRPRDLIKNEISLNFLRNNKYILGAIYAQAPRFALKNFLPTNELSDLKIKRKSKIKIRIPYIRFWNTLRTICEACRQDRDIDLLLIANENYEKDQLIRQGYNCIIASEYDVKSDQPDIFALNYLYGDAHRKLGDIRKYTHRVIVTSHALVLYGGLNGFIKQVDEYWEPYSPDYYLFDSLLYQKLRTVDYFKDKPLVEMGNSKYDGIFKACNSVKSVDGWEKLNGKKVILWTTDHGIYEGSGVIDDTSFDIYAKDIFKYIREHSDMAMIFRPHSTFLLELTKYYSIWSEDTLNEFREWCHNSFNVIFDETDNYDNAFSVSDAILVDPHCGIVASALPTMKPICLPYRSRNVKEHDMEIMNSYYKAYSCKEIFDFFKMVEHGDDPMRSEREKTAREYVKHFDGKNGWRIKEFMKQAFQSKIMT